MSLKFTVLGCSNSSGVPAPGNFWGACDPNEPKNNRMRCSLAVQSEKTTIIIDTGPDFRQQMNMYNIPNLDAVLYTHQHSDHCHGIDDLRFLYFKHGKNRINVYGNQKTFDDMIPKFRYLFEGGNSDEFYPPILKANIINDFGTTHKINDIEFIPFLMDHGTCQSTGYRFGDVSYCVDMKSLDDAALKVLKGSRVWIVDGAAYKNPDNAVHANLETLYQYNTYIGAKDVYITSLSTQMDYKTLCAELPDGFYPAYDGLVIED